MNPKWVVREVKPLDDYRLWIRFEDRQSKIFDMSRLLDGKVFEPLKNVALFNMVHVEACTAVWTDEIDIDPELLYEQGVPCSEHL